MAAGLMPAAAQAPTPVPASALLACAPHATLTNGAITATLYPPGDNSFYRGTRFDHAGVIGSLKLNGHEFYGPWFEAVQDDVPDFRWIDGRVVTGRASSTMGPAEEFDPVGFDEAAPGGTFLLPGVGLLLRPDARAYNHFTHYERAPGSDSRSTSVNINNARVNNSTASMTHTVSGRGFGYEYTKTLTLPPERPQLVITHTLRNTGQKPIVGSVYDHNFAIFNPGQADMKVTLPFAPPQPPATSHLKAEGNAITWPAPLQEGQSGAMTMSTAPQPYDFTVTDTRTGASFRAQCDQPASQYKLWSIKTVMAVEPYVAINVPPGGEQRWTYTYTYSA
jgi:hypothetical protein